MPKDNPPSNLTILRPAERDAGKAVLTRSEKSQNNRIRHAKLELMAVVMRLDDLGVDVSRINLADVLEFGRRFNNL